MSSFQKFLDFLNRLDEAELPYSLEHNSEETLLVMIAVEGERWEVMFTAEGHIHVEVFYSAEAEFGPEGEEALERLFDDEDAEEDEDEDDGDDDDRDEDEGDEDSDTAEDDDLEEEDDDEDWEEELPERVK